MSRLILDGWQVVIGIETHVQLKTRQKLFSRANTSLLSHSPNSRHNAFDAAFPGTLPKLNPKCLDLAVRAALALNCKVQNRSSFDRKHYFYSDQPVGYQITQHYAPFALNGFLKPPKLDLPDTGKSIYNARSRISSIDLNRAGTGLLEIVTEPDLSSPEEAAEYVRSLQSTLRAMGVSDGNMEAGDLRCDVNVSMNRPGEARGTRCEIKNLNSVRFMVAAIHHEIERQKGILSSNSSVLQETRGFDENRFETYTIRSKEDAPDYRYMPDPNLGVLIVNDTTIERIRKSLPESPEAMRTRLLTTYGPHGVNNASIDVLMGLDASRDVPFDGEVSSQQESAVPYFEVLAQGRDPREVVNWITQILLGQLSSLNQTFSPKHLSVPQMGELIDLVISGKMTRSSGKLLLRHVLTNPSPSVLMKEMATHLDLIVSEAEEDTDQYTEICSRAIAALPSEVAAIQAGNVNVMNKLIGRVMRDTKGKVDVQKVRKTMESLIKIS
ncbi:aspartyl glutamyl-trna amidotransferase subunit b [Moniliophthora roreri]|nr:aspartyl glutamyl-trna amidotransferase subunit b [Moniliophthora roreri]